MSTEKAALMKQLRYKAVEQKTLSFADLRLRFACRPPRRSGWRYGADFIEAAAL
jgi:hypothetical protein